MQFVCSAEVEWRKICQLEGPDYWELVRGRPSLRDKAGRGPRSLGLKVGPLFAGRAAGTCSGPAVVGIAPFHSCILPPGSGDEMSHPRSSSGVWRRETGQCVCRRGTGGQRDRRSGPVREAQALVLSSWAKPAWPPSCEGVGDAANTSQNPDSPKRPLGGLAHGARGQWLGSPSAWGLVVKPAQALCTSGGSGDPQSCLVSGTEAPGAHHPPAHPPVGPWVSSAA